MVELVCFGSTMSVRSVQSVQPSVHVALSLHTRPISPKLLQTLPNISLRPFWTSLYQDNSFWSFLKLNRTLPEIILSLPYLCTSFISSLQFNRNTTKLNQYQRRKDKEVIPLSNEEIPIYHVWRN